MICLFDVALIFNFFSNNLYKTGFHVKNVASFVLILQVMTKKPMLHECYPIYIFGRGSSFFFLSFFFFCFFVCFFFFFGGGVGWEANMSWTRM